MSASYWTCCRALVTEISFLQGSSDRSLNDKLSSVTDAEDLDDELVQFAHEVDHPIVSDPDAERLPAGELTRSRRLRIVN